MELIKAISIPKTVQARYTTPNDGLQYAVVFPRYSTFVALFASSEAAMQFVRTMCDSAQRNVEVVNIKTGEAIGP